MKKINIDIVKNLVDEFNYRDSNWDWKLIKCDEQSIELGWGYLEYIEETNNFSVYLDDEAEEYIGKCPNGEIINIDDDPYYVMKEIKYFAHSRY